MTARACEVSVRYDVSRTGVPAARSIAGWVAAALQGSAGKRRQVNVALLDEARSRELNRHFRGKDYATNVLSFAHEPLPGQEPTLLGELAICAPVVAREARDQGKPLRNHYAHLTIHGVLHLLGHDHQGERTARRMEALERRILAGLGIADPYR